MATAFVFHEVRHADHLPADVDKDTENPAPLSEIHPSACNYRLRTLLNSRRNIEYCGCILVLLEIAVKLICHTFMSCCHIIVTYAIVVGIV